jgi:hypothetical protein
VANHATTFSTPGPLEREKRNEKKNVMPEVRLDREAYQLLVLYMKKNPGIYLYETHDHGIDPIWYPDMYMEIELLEPEHKDILGIVLENRGVITVPIVKEWMQEESHAHSQ